MREEGLLSDTEFEAMRRHVLGLPPLVGGSVSVAFQAGEALICKFSGLLVVLAFYAFWNLCMPCLLKAPRSSIQSGWRHGPVVATECR